MTLISIYQQKTHNRREVDGSRSRRVVWLLLLLLPALTGEGLSQCTRDRIAEAARTVGVLESSTLDIFGAGRFTADEGSARTFLVEANHLATRLSEVLGIVTPPSRDEVVPNEAPRRGFNASEKQGLLCLQDTLIKFYEKVGEGLLRAEDHLARASILLHHSIIFPETDFPRTPGTLLGRALRDYESVYSAALQVLEDRGGSYATYGLAVKLGIDLNQPAPAFEHLDEFVKLAVATSIHWPDHGSQIGTVLQQVLCAGYYLYPGRRDTIERSDQILIRLDRGDLAVSAPVFRFVGRVNKILRLSEISFEKVGSPCESGSPGRLLRFGEPMVELTVPDVLLERLAEAEKELSSSLSLVSERGLGYSSSSPKGWMPFESYSELLYRIAETLAPSYSADSETWELRSALRKRSCMALIRGLQSIGITIESESRERLRRILLERIDEHVGDLFARLWFKKAAEFAAHFSQQNYRKLLQESQWKRFNTLLARAYFMDCQNANALRYLRSSDTTITKLREFKTTYHESGLDVSCPD